MRIIITVLILFASAAGAPVKGEVQMQQYTFYEASGNIHTDLQVIADQHDVYIPFTQLSQAFQITRKALPSEHVGVCVEDLCVPMQTGEQPGNIKVIDGTEYVPLGSFLYAITAHYVRDNQHQLFLFDLNSRTEKAAGNDGSPANFTLPTMDGEQIRLDRYRGKKVILFAWASW